LEQQMKKKSLLGAILVLGSLIALLVAAPAGVQAQPSGGGAGIDSQPPVHADDYPHRVNLSALAQGAAWDNGRFWVILSGNPAQIVRIDVDGQEEASFDAPGDPSGLAFDGTNLWVMDSAAGTVYQLDQNGDQTGTLTPPAGVSPGIAHDGQHLWAADWANGRLYQINPANGQVLSTATTDQFAGQTIFGITRVGDYLWLSTTTGVYRISTSTGDTKAVYQAAFSDGPAKGLTHDGVHFWGAGGSVERLDRLNISEDTLQKAAPTVSTWRAYVRYDDAVLYGYVKPNGSPTRVWFEIGLTPNLGSRSGYTNLPAGYETYRVWTEYYNLDYDQTYYYRVVAENELGVSYGDTLSFRTEDYWAEFGGCFLESVLSLRP
jgi:hypothetical protein